MNKLKKIIAAICFGASLPAFYMPTLAQTVPTASAKSSGSFVKWQMLSGKDNEFFFAVPENAIIYTDKNFYLDNRNYARVDYVKTMISRLGNTVLKVDLYDGTVKDVQRVLINDLKEDIKRAKDSKENQLEVKEVEKN